MMRLAILFGLLLAIFGSAGRYFIPPVDSGHDLPFSARYRNLLAEEPETVYRHLDDAFVACAPEVARFRPELRRRLVQEFAATVALRAGGQDEGVIERNVAERAAAFSASERAALIRTLETSIEESRRTCILSDAKRGLTLHMAVKSGEWDLRR